MKYFAKETKMTHENATEITNYFLKAFRNFLKNMKAGDVLELRGLGVFKVVYQRGRYDCRNPKTNERSVMAARRRLRFQPSKILKKAYRKIV